MLLRFFKEEKMTYPQQENDECLQDNESSTNTQLGSPGEQYIFF